MDERNAKTCGDCMWIVYDKDGDCWDFCKGKYKPSTTRQELITTYYVDNIKQCNRLLPILKKGDIIVIDEDPRK